MPNSPFSALIGTDPFDNAARSNVKGGKGIRGFEGGVPPSINGRTTRTGVLQPNRAASNARNLIRWIAPEQPIIEMYINPSNLSITESKQISKIRTKGGFALQYWGENLIDITLTGTTGTSGIEGINVLRDIYRNEQLMFDPYTLALQAKFDAKANNDPIDTLFDSFEDSFLGGLTSIFSGGEEVQVSRDAPTLASLAFTVEMYWSGEVYRGYFESFQFTEKIDSLGLFDYIIKFTATQKRGFRQNFLPWHRSPLMGPSDSGRDDNYSFNKLAPTSSKAPGGTSGDNFVASIYKAGEIAEVAGKALYNVGKDIVDAFDVF